MKRIILFLSVLLLCSQAAFAYDFSAVAPSGQTLYYNIVNGHAEVVRPGGGVSYNNYVSGNLTIPDTVTCNGTTLSVTHIDEGAFHHCTGLTSVTIPNSVTHIDEGAFHHCPGLTSVTIPNSVTSIGSSAFYYCTGLTSVTIGNSVTSIGSSAFTGCTGLTSVVFNADNCTDAGFTSSTSSDGNTYYYWAFKGCTNITSFVFGDNVKNIPFCLCRELTGLTSVTIPDSVTSIDDGAFYQCSGLTSVTIGNSVTSIGNSAFYQCSSLTSVTIPNSVTNLDNYAFYQCTSLASVTIGNSVTSINRGAFYGCTSLTSVTIPNSVISIGIQAFCGCHLTSVTIGNSVTLIKYEAFSPCALSSITFLSPTPPSFNGYDFNQVFGVLANYVVYIPCGSISQYWNIISGINILQMYYELSAVSADDSTGTVQILTEPSCTNHNAILSAVPANGYRFDHWSTGSTDNPYTLTVTSDTTITAFFEEAHTVTVLVDNPATGNVTGGGAYEDGSSVTITAYPADGYLFDHWSTGSTDNPYTLTVTSDTTITAFFVKAYTVTVLVDNPATGSVTGGGVYENGTPVTITAYQANGYHFDHWSTGSTDNPYTLTVICDTTITAYFVSNGGTEGIGEIGEDDIRISVSDGRIHVEGITNEEVRVYDITGRLVQNHSLQPGVYMVKIGTLPPQKVVVMR